MSDEEDMVVHVRSIDGKVIVTFPAMVDYISMPPEKAEAFAALILDAAKAARARLERDRLNSEQAPPGTKPS